MAHTESDQASCFAVEWLEPDAGHLSVVPRRKIISDPPLDVRTKVLVRFTTRKGHTKEELALLKSQGRRSELKVEGAERVNITESRNSTA